MSEDLGARLAGGARLDDLLNQSVDARDLGNQKTRTKLAAWSVAAMREWAGNLDGIGPREAQAQWTTLATQKQFILGLACQYVEDQNALTRDILAVQMRQGYRKWGETLMRQLRIEADAVKRAARRDGAGKPSQGRRIVSLLERVEDQLADIKEGLDLPEDLSVPVGWRLNSGGIWRVQVDGQGEEQTENICRVPMLITGILRDASGDGSQVIIRWRSRGTWRSYVTDRKTVAIARSLAELAQYDMPVSSQSAPQLVGWFEAFMVANDSSIPEARVSSHLGWQGTNDFLWGKHRITIDGVESAALDGNKWDDEGLHLNTHKPGAAATASGYRESGDWETWKALVSNLTGHPRFGLLIYASLAAPILRCLPEAPNFCLDLAGETSRGKTTALRLAASVWGLPSERDGGLIWSWDATPTWIERTAAMCSDLPLILDDSKRAKPERVSGIVYSVAQGVGRGRGTIAGQQEMSRWRTVLISTGEAPLTHYATEGGASARILSLWGSPFRNDGTDHGRAARAIARTCHEHYGHLGPRIVQMLMDQDVVAACKTEYYDAVDRWSKLMAGSPVGARLAQYLGVLSVAEFLYLRAGMPAFVSTPLAEAYSVLRTSIMASDRAASAVIDLTNWAASETPQHIARGDELEPPLSCYGKWSGYGENGGGWDTCYILYRVAKDTLTKMGYDAAAILSTWSERGWIITDKNSSSPTKTAMMPRSRMSARFVAIKRDGYDKAHHVQTEDLERETRAELKRKQEELEQAGLWG